MARYRSKDEVDLHWNFTRRRITRDLDTQLMDIREEILDKLLTDAWNKFSAALESGELVQLEDEASAWIDGLLRKRLTPTATEVPRVRVAKRKTS